MDIEFKKMKKILDEMRWNNKNKANLVDKMVELYRDGKYIQALQIYERFDSIWHCIANKAMVVYCGDNWLTIARKESSKKEKTMIKVKCEEAPPPLHYEVKECKQTKCLHYKFHVENEGCEKDEECLQWNQKPCCFERNNRGETAILSSLEQKEKLLEVVKFSPELEKKRGREAVSDGNYLYGGSIRR